MLDTCLKLTKTVQTSAQKIRLRRAHKDALFFRLLQVGQN